MSENHVDPRLLNRIQERLQALGLRETDADRKAGVPVGTIRNLRRAVEAGRGRGGMLPSTLQKLAPALGTTVEWLSGVPTSEDADVIEIPIAGLPVLGEIRAGGWLDTSIIQDERPVRMLPIVRDARFPHARQYALEVLGDSMDLDFPEHSFVTCVDFAESGLTLRKKMIVHVERRNGTLVEITLKQVDRVGGVMCLVPRSSNPVHQPYPLPKWRNGKEEPAQLAGTEVYVRGVVIGKYEVVNV